MQRLVGKYSYCLRGLNISHVSRCLLFYSTETTNNAFTNYLVRSLGFSHQQAVSTSNRLCQYQKHCTNRVNDFKFEANANSVVNFFKTNGFDDSHIVRIVSYEPRLLSSKVEKTLAPKLQFLQNLGFSGTDVVQVISLNPNLLFSGLESSILPALQILKQLLVCDTLVNSVVKKLRCRGFRGITKNLLPNVALLSDYGISIKLIRNYFLKQPFAFLLNRVIFKDALIRAEKQLGIRKDSPLFLHGIHLAATYSEENIESKFRMFKNFGWTQSEVKTFVMKNACFFLVSEYSIKKKLDFLMNEVGLEPSYLTSKCAFLTCSLEKRIVPRHKVLLYLNEKGLLKKNPSFYYAICMSESRFLNKFVLPFKEVHEVYAKKTGSGVKLLA